MDLSLDVVTCETDAMRRSKASLSEQRATNLRAEQLLRGCKLETRMHDPGIELEDIREKAERTEV